VRIIQEERLLWLILDSAYRLHFQDGAPAGAQTLRILAIRRARRNKIMSRRGQREQSHAGPRDGSVEYALLLEAGRCGMHEHDGHASAFTSMIR